MKDLGEAIAVTVIATGFNIDQQDDIVNTESKKIIHTLEDEQRASQDLMSRKTVHHQLDEEEEVEEPQAEYTLLMKTMRFDLIPTTNYIKNFNVFYEEVIAENVSEDDFVIID